MKRDILQTKKKSQFQSAIIAVVTIFIIAIIIFFIGHLRNSMYEGFDDVFENDPDLKDSTADQTLETINSVENAAWDWGFFAIFMGIMIQMLIFSFATRTNVAFYWIFAIMGIVVLIVGTVLSNIWQEMASNPEFAVTITRFPIMNTILGTYYPTVIVGVLFLFMIILFGKPPTQQ